MYLLLFVKHQVILSIEIYLYVRDISQIKGEQIALHSFLSKMFTMNNLVCFTSLKFTQNFRKKWERVVDSKNKKVNKYLSNQICTVRFLLQSSIHLSVCNPFYAIHLYLYPYKHYYTAEKMKFSIKNFFSKYDQIRWKLRIWSHLRKKSLMENFIFCAV